MRCSHCGDRIDPNDRFCRYCGADRHHLASDALTRAASEQINLEQQRLRRLGRMTERVWQSHDDEDTCEDCRAFHGQTETVWKQQFPHGPPAHYGCRCSMTLRMKT